VGTQLQIRDNCHRLEPLRGVTGFNVVRRITVRVRLGESDQLIVSAKFNPLSQLRELAPLYNHHGKMTISKIYKEDGTCITGGWDKTFRSCDIKSGDVLTVHYGPKPRITSPRYDYMLPGNRITGKILSLIPKTIYNRQSWI
jgi:hypothetical protein